MDKSFKQALMSRRSYYELSDSSTLSDKEIEELLGFAIKYVPSAFNSQSTRMVLLLHEAHAKMWNIVKETLRAIVPPEVFGRTEKKIDTSFASGYGTVLFFEDRKVVERLQRESPTYAATFPAWAEHTSAMHQLAVWTMLEEAGMGASLQHYNPLIDKQVREMWHLPEHWSLIAQMPFGKALDTPAGKEFEPVGERLFVFDR